MNYLRTTITFAILLVCLHVAKGQVVKLLEDPTVWPPDDYVEYWAAGRLNLYGVDPYEPANLLPLERFAGRKLEDGEAVMMWNPPWTLSFVMPLGALPPRQGQLAWLALGLMSLGVSAWLIWESFIGLGRKRWWAFGLVLTFLPTLFVLQSGQIGPLLVLGAAGFIWACRNGHLRTAGVLACLLAIKPHLVYLFWPALLLDGVRTRSWKMPGAGIIVGIVLSAIPTIANPDVWEQFFAAYVDHPPKQWVSPSPGTFLRMMALQARGTEGPSDGMFWVQFVPMSAGLIWFAWHWMKHRREWDWVEQTPILILVSFVTAPYGAWHFDLVLLLVPILHRAAKLSICPLTLRGKLGFVGLVVANSGMLALAIADAWTYWYFWVAPTTLGLYALTEPRDAADRKPVADQRQVESTAGPVRPIVIPDTTEWAEDRNPQPFMPPATVNA